MATECQSEVSGCRGGLRHRGGGKPRRRALILSLRRSTGCLLAAIYGDDGGGPSDRFDAYRRCRRNRSRSFCYRSFSTEIRAEPIQIPGDNPFTSPVGRDQPNVMPLSNTGRTFPGGTLGLYGGTLNNSSCDRDAMVAFLRSNLDEEAAWASVQGISPADLPAYIAELTPLILRSATAVTNHGFTDGKATTVHSVLQAGTAVLVGKFGVPRARCYCENPLTPPQTFSRPRYVGAVWSGFSQTNITIVQPATCAINEFIIVNPNH